MIIGIISTSGACSSSPGASAALGSDAATPSRTRSHAEEDSELAAETGPDVDRDLTHHEQFEAARRTIETEFGRVALVENGRGPAAVFLHGFPLNGYHWRHQLTELADIRRCIAIDLMGLGYTEVATDQSLRFSDQARMVLATLDALGVEQFDLVGNDSGGGVAQLISARAPERVRTLVLTNADTHDNWPPQALDVVHTLATQGKLGDVLASYIKNTEAARSGLGALVYEDPEHITPALLEAYLAPITATEARKQLVNRFITSQDNSETVAIEEHLKRLQAPTLILWGTGDVFFDVEWAYWLRDTIPGAVKVVEFPNAKLFFPEEHPAQVSAHIREHWLR